MHKRKISQIRSAARKTPIITNKQLKLAIERRLMANKKQYSTETVLMAECHLKLHCKATPDRHIPFTEVCTILLYVIDIQTNTTFFI